MANGPFKMKGSPMARNFGSPFNKVDKTYDPETQTRASRWIYGEEGWIPDSWQGGKRKSRRVKVNPKSKTYYGSGSNFDGSKATTDNRGRSVE